MSNGDSNRTAIYTRISEDTAGERAGVERQRAECEQLAERLGLTVVDVFPDNLEPHDTRVDCLSGRGR